MAVPRSHRTTTAACALVVTAGLALAGLAPASAGPAKGPDVLVAKKAQVQPRQVEAGASVRVGLSVSNRGDRRARPTRVRFHLAQGATLRRGDLRLATSPRVGAIAPRKSRRVTATLRVPPGTAGGDYRLIACVDPVRGEARKARRNNCRNLGKLQVKATVSSFPARYVGTATAVHRYEVEGTGTTSGSAGPSSEEATYTLRSTNIVLERQGSGTDTRYVATGGQLEWTVAGTALYTGNNAGSCTESGTGVLPIRNAGSGIRVTGMVQPTGTAGMAAGQGYRRTSVSAFETGPWQTYTRACGDAPLTAQYRPHPWLSLHVSTGSGACAFLPSYGNGQVAAGGVLRGTESCRHDDMWTLPGNGNTFTSVFTSSVTWNLTPQG